MRVWVVYRNDLNEEGDSVADYVAIYATEQTAKQHADRHGPGLHVHAEDVRTTVREY
jgi:hypothetical protein